MRKSIFYIGMLVLMLATATCVDAASGHSHPIMKVSNSHGMHTMMNPLTSISTIQTYNWAGYSVDGATGSVTDVKGSWIVPTINTTTPDQYGCHWIGIDWDNSATVEQIGIDTDTDDDGNPYYYAWYGCYPDSGDVIDMTISPGDVLKAEVNYTGGNFVLSLVDVTTSASFSITQPDNSYARSSAEWIVEAPMCDDVLPLVNFGTEKFGQNYTQVSNTCKATISGQTKTIGAFSAINKIVMINYSSQVKAQPSTLSTDGSSFQVQWVRAS